MKNNNQWRKAYYVLLVIILIYLFQPKGGTWAFLLNIRWLYVLMLSFVFAQLLTPISIGIAWKFGILDYPNEARKIHKAPIPRIGGLAVFLSIMFTCMRNLKFDPALTGLLVGSSLIYILGFIDDINPLSAVSRILVQIVACVILITNGIFITAIPNTIPFHLPINYILTVLWLIGMANALNFLDGVDGLCAGLAALCAGLFFLIALPTHQKFLVYLTIAIAGSCLGFITYNWKPASVYLGDAGATFLGFLLAGTAIMGTWAEGNPVVALSTPLLILGIPIFDMIYTTISRIHNGQVKSFIQWLEYAGRDHFHHRLMHLGLKDVQTVIFILFINLCIGLGALVLREAGTKGSLLLLLQSTVIFLIITILMLLGKERTNEKTDKIFGLLRDTYKNGSLTNEMEKK